jgi:fumarate reductase subunit D
MPKTDKRKRSHQTFIFTSYSCLGFPVSLQEDPLILKMVLLLVKMGFFDIHNCGEVSDSIVITSVAKTFICWI